MGSPTLASAAPLTQPLSDITLTAPRAKSLGTATPVVLLSISAFAQSSAGLPLTSGINSAGRIHYTHRPRPPRRLGLVTGIAPVAHQEEWYVSWNTGKAPTIDNLRKLTEFRLILLAMVEGTYGHDQH